MSEVTSTSTPQVGSHPKPESGTEPEPKAQQDAPLQARSRLPEEAPAPLHPSTSQSSAEVVAESAALLQSLPIPTQTPAVEESSPAPTVIPPDSTVEPLEITAIPPVTPSAQSELAAAPFATHTPAIEETAAARVTITTSVASQPTDSPLETAIPFTEASTTAESAVETMTAPVQETSTPAPLLTNTTLEIITVAQSKGEGEEGGPQQDDAVTAELQNKLTDMFTQPEWDALKKFRTDLPAILAEAFPDRPDAHITSVKLWGVTIDPQDPVKDARVSVILIKFLRARNLSPSAARDMLVNTLRWRESFDIEKVLEEEFPEEIFGNLAHTYGRDKEGRPVVYNLYGANPDIKSVFSDVQRFVRWRVALQERSVELLDFTEIDQMIQIHDYAGVSLSSRDANSKAAASEATNIFASHYPELLYKKFFINVPTLLNWIFWAFKPLIPAATLAKMMVVGTGQYSQKKALLPHIDEENLPERYGGNAEAF